MSVETEIASTSGQGCAEASSPASATPPAFSIGLKRILVPVDFSQTCRKALRYANRFAGIYGSTVMLFHVVDLTDIERISLRLGPIAQERMETEAVKHAQALTSQMADDELAADVPRECEILRGVAASGIVEKARDWNADLIITGVHNERVVRHAILGSTAERIVRHAPCPVFVVRDKEHEFIET